MDKVRIRLVEISKSYYSETAVTQALRKINLTLGEGEFVAITGESGSGKSTLLNVIGGMDTFDDGEMFVDGESTSVYDDADWEAYRRNKIGYVFQDYSLIGHYTALDNVMSALLIMNKDIDESRGAAMRYLEQVGLGGLEDHRASELSSGQKQRLSIARALAKETGIIVADEPTGNLDSETGDQIIGLLKELSRDRLVIMVTHNYDQVEPYATRKIRLHDGEIISDVAAVTEKENPDLQTEDETNIEELRDGSVRPTNIEELRDGSMRPTDARAQARMLRRRQNRTAAHFAALNRRTAKGRSVLFTTFLFIVSTVAFLLIGELYQYADDVHTRSYEKTAFYKEDDTRLVVARKDGKPLEVEDLDELSSVHNVVAVDSCDYSNDINYYIDEDIDYKYIYGTYKTWNVTVQTVDVTFLHEDRFVLSTDCITEDDLAFGRMPESRREIILYSDDESILGSTRTVYFTSPNLYGPNQYYCMDLTVCGLLKTNDHQVYFSRELCRMLGCHMDSAAFRLHYNWENRNKDYSEKVDFIPMIADDLTGSDVRLSSRYGEDAPVGETVFHLAQLDDDGNDSSDWTEQIVYVRETGSPSSVRFMEVSQEFYDRYYQWKGTQASVYITNYAKTDSILHTLDQMGYEALSTYRVSTGDYVEELVNNRLVIIGISAGGLLALAVACVLILRSLMKIRIKDYFILKFIGMRLKMIGRISYYEMIAYSIWAMAMTVILMWILRLAGIPLLTDLMWYYNWKAYLTFVLYNLLIWALTTAAFNILLKGRLKA